MIEKLKKALAQRQIIPNTIPGLTPAGVLVPLFLKDGEHHLLFTKRTERVRDHKGQISFPGGSYEEDDADLQATALREAEEEVGLKPSDVEVLGRLDDMPTIGSSFVISPYVGLIPWPYDFKLDAFEVAGNIEIPVSWLMDERNHTQEISYELGAPLGTYFYRYGGDVIWGASARILNQFLEIYRQVKE